MIIPSMFSQVFKQLKLSVAKMVRGPLTLSQLSPAFSLSLSLSVLVLPYLQNTGGFIVAVLCKTSLLLWQSKVIPSLSDGSEVGKTRQKPSELFGR